MECGSEPPHSGFRGARPRCPIGIMDMTMTCVDCFSNTSLLAEVVPLYITGTIAFLAFITLKRALLGKPRLVLFRAP